MPVLKSGHGSRTSTRRAKHGSTFELAFRELFVRDLRHADRGDVRMGTFILCAAFLDALSLTYSAGMKDFPNGKAGKWSRFLKDYLGERGISRFGIATTPTATAYCTTTARVESRSHTGMGRPASIWRVSATEV